MAQADTQTSLPPAAARPDPRRPLHLEEELALLRHCVLRWGNLGLPGKRRGPKAIRRAAADMPPAVARPDPSLALAFKKLLHSWGQLDSGQKRRAIKKIRSLIAIMPADLRDVWTAAIDQRAKTGEAA